MALSMVLLLGSAAAQDRTSDLRARFERETDAVRKAKLMPGLGEAQFGEIRQNVRDGKFSEATATLDQYRAEAEQSEKALAATGIDAEKHPAGFKELEISLRESLRRLNEMLPGITSDERPPFMEAHRELDEMDQRLVHALFPRHS